MVEAVLVMVMEVVKVGVVEEVGRIGVVAVMSNYEQVSHPIPVYWNLRQIMPGKFYCNTR